MEINDLLKKVVEAKGSDLHLSSGIAPKMRLYGEICDIEGYENITLNDEIMEEAIKVLNPSIDISTLKEEKDMDFAYELEDVSRFRVNIFFQQSGISAVLRTIPSKILSLEDLSAPAILKELARKKKGLVLVTGATGSGKSTTLAAMIDYINENRSEHILTIEDPVEFSHKNKKCIVNQREVFKDTKSFSSALKAALREDPDIILIGELRDLETIRLALTAAETGHLVFGTLHTSSAAKTIDRIVDVFPADEKGIIRTMLSESLEAVISQTLLPRKSGKGLVAAHEIMIGIPAIRNLIRENKTAQMKSVMQSNSALGMTTLDTSLRALLAKQVIDKEAAEPYMKSKD